MQACGSGEVDVEGRGALDGRLFYGLQIIPFCLSHGAEQVQVHARCTKSKGGRWPGEVNLRADRSMTARRPGKSGVIPAGLVLSPAHLKECKITLLSRSQNRTICLVNWSKTGQVSLR
jgi:hypothetical protein